jgi:hypothetical protein
MICKNIVLYFILLFLSIPVCFSQCDSIHLRQFKLNKESSLRIVQMLSKHAGNDMENSIYYIQYGLLTLPDDSIFSNIELTVFYGNAIKYIRNHNQIVVVYYPVCYNNELCFEFVKCKPIFDRGILRIRHKGILGYVRLESFFVTTDGRILFYDGLR